MNNIVRVGSKVCLAAALLINSFAFGAVPVISGLSPTSGTNGTPVAISGANFGTFPSNNIVYFGAVRATVTSANQSNLLVTVPVGATYAPVTVLVNGLVAYTSKPFQPTFAGSGAAFTSASLGPQLTFGMPSGPQQVAIGDLDGDGKPDLIINNAYANNISLFRNISSGGTLTTNSFAARVDLPPLDPSGTLDSPYDVIVGDVDGDGKLDIVTVDGFNNKIVVYRNISSPGNLTTNSFAPAVSFDATGNPRGVRIADIDGDGRADIVFSAQTSGVVSVLRNIGTAGSINSNSFAAAVSFPAGSSPEFTAVGDLDGDGKPDLAVVNTGDSTVSVYRNISTPGVINSNSFAARVDFPAPSTPIALEIADIDGDGKADLLVGGYFGPMSVYRNTSTVGSLTTSSFAPSVDFATAGRSHTIALGDLNGDGKTDIALVTELDSALSLFENVSTPGAFSNSSLAPRVDYATGYNAWGVAVGDLNGDGRPDIVFGNSYDTTISVYQNLDGATVLNGPVITSQPTNQTVSVGGTASFSVTATGSPTLQYQWVGPGTNSVNGGTNSTLTLSNVQPSAAGVYYVVVFNSAGYAISSNALLTVNGGTTSNTAPVITKQPTNQTVSAGGTATFSVTATGSPTLHYQWYGPGSSFIPGAVNPTLTLSNVQPGNAGSYFVFVTNLFGFAQSSNAVLTVNGGSGGGGTSTNGLVIPNYLATNQNNAANGTLNEAERQQMVYSASQFPAVPITITEIRWRPDQAAGGPLSLTISNLQIHLSTTAASVDGLSATFPQNVGSNDTVVFNGAAHLSTAFTMQSDGTMVFDLSLPLQTPFVYDSTKGNLLVDLHNFTGCTPAHGNFVNGTDSSTDAVSRIVSFNPNATNADFVDSGGDVLEIIYTSGGGSSNTAPVITKQPTNQTVSAGGTASFSVTATGSPTLHYQWYGPGSSLIAGAVNATLTLSNVQPANAGAYFVFVTNLFGFAQSSNAVLTVNGGSSGGGTSTNGLVIPNYLATNQNNAANGTLNEAERQQMVYSASQFPAVPITITEIRWRPDQAAGGPLSLTISNLQIHLSTTAASVDGLSATFPQNVGSNDTVVFNGAAHLSTAFTMQSDGTMVFDLSLPLQTPFVYDSTKGNLLVDLHNFTGCTPAHGNFVNGTDSSTDAVSRIVSFNPNATNADFVDSGGDVLEIIYTSAGGISNTAPVITHQPTNQTVSAGGTATFSVTASGSPTLHYQWYGPGSSLIAGATASTLTLSNVEPGNAGAYFAFVTNLFGFAQSSNAVLTVTGGGGGGGSNTCTPPPSGLVGWWKGEGNANDSAGTNNGIYRGSNAYGTAKVGLGFVFFRTDQDVRIPANSNLDLGLSGGLTLESWILATDLSKYNPIFEWNPGDGVNYWGVQMYVIPNGTLYANVQGVGDVWHQIQSDPGIISSNKFQHVALAYDKVSGVARLYRNGAVVAEQNFGSFIPKTTGDLNIGSRPTDPAGQHFTFSGTIDEPSIYSRALSSNEVEAIYNAGTAGKCAASSDAPPTITTQPTNQTAVTGGAATFSVTATGSPTLHYQWFGPGSSLIAGATASTLTLSNVQPSNAGAYFVFVTNSFGFAQSSNAVLTVNGGGGNTNMIVIVQQPTNQTVAVGGTATFSVTATGSPTLHYQWYGPGSSLIAGAVNPTLTLSNVQPGNAGSYFVFVTNLFGFAQSSNAVLTVTGGGGGSNTCTPPASGLVGWWKGEGNANDSAGTNNGALLNGVSFTTGEVGQGFLFAHTNQNVKIPANSNLDVGLGGGLTLEAWINPANLSQYNPIMEWNLGDAVNYFGVHLYVIPLGPDFGNQPGNLYADIQGSDDSWHQLWSSGQTVASNKFQHVALTYDKASGIGRLYYNGTVVAENNFGNFTPKTTGPLNIGNRPTSPADEHYTFAGVIDEPSVYNRALASSEIAALYNAGASGKCTSTVSNAGPVITKQPTNQTVSAGGSATFSVTASGSPTLHYQWYFGGNLISGATSSSLTLSNVQPSNAGSYFVFVTNLFGFAQSSNAVLTVTGGGSDGSSNGLVVPNYSATNQVVGGGGTFDVVLREQTVYGASQFPSNPIVITELRWRPDQAAGGPLSVTVSNLQIHLSTTAANPDGLSSIFAQNTGTNDTTVFNGTASLSSGFITLSNGTKAFDISLPLQTPFTYDPSKGNLLVDVRNFSGDTPAKGNFINAASGADATSRVYALNANATNASIADSGGDVLEIIYTSGGGSSNTAPVITKQPTNQTVSAGGTASFSVTATGSPTLHYQWYGPGSSLIAGAVNATLTLSNVQPANAGAYFVFVTNLFGFAQSSNAVLTVNGGGSGGSSNGLVVPNYSATNQINASGGEFNSVIREQTVYNASEFPAGPITITEIRWRPDQDAGGPISTTISNLQIHLSTTKTNADNLSPTFAQNIGADDAVVFNGAFHLTTSFITLSNGTTAFDIRLPLQTPFTYDPSKGNLLMDFRNFTGCNPNEGNFLNVAGATDATSRAYAFDPNGTTASVTDTGGGVLQIIYTAATTSNAAPVITKQPTNQSVSAGATATFSVTATGSPTLHYQWYGPGSSLIAGAVNATLTLSNVQPANAGSYFVFVTNLFGFAQSSNAVLTVNGGGSGGSSNGLVVPNYSATNQINASGGEFNSVIREQTVYNASEFPAGPITITEIRWRPDQDAGGPISTTISNLQIHLSTTKTNADNLSPTFAQNIGADDAVVFNGAFHLTTSFITLSNGTTAFDIRLPLQTPFTYDPSKGNLLMDFRNFTGCNPNEGNFLNVAGATDATSRAYAFSPNATNAEVVDTGGGVLQIIYTVNGGISNTAPVITKQPTNQTVSAGGTATFSVTATGSPTLHYQWYGPGSSFIPGAVNPTLTLSNVQPANAGAYFVFVTNLFGFAQSSNAVLTVTGGGGGSNTCTPPPSGLVAWWKGEGNGLDSAGTNNGTLLGNLGFTNGEVGQAFNFTDTTQGVHVNASPSLAVKNLTIEAWIRPIDVSDFHPIIEYGQDTGPDPVEFLYGWNDPGGSTPGALFGIFRGTNDTTLLINSSGGILPAGQWSHVAMTFNFTNQTGTLYLNGVAVGSSVFTNGVMTPQTSLPIHIGYRPNTSGEGRAGDRLSGGLDEVSIYNRTLSASEIQAIYHAGSSGKCTSDTSLAIITQPTNATAIVGSTAKLSVTAVGTGPLSYQWFKTNSLVPGATNSTLIFSNVQFSAAGIYHVVVSDSHSSVNSSNATLSVIAPPVAAVVAVDTSATAGSTFDLPINLIANGNENALSFTLNFDATRMTFSSINLGNSATNGLILPNTSHASNGVVGVALALPAGVTFNAGTQQIVRVTFIAAVTNTQTVSLVSFADAPVNRLISDAAGNSVAASFVSGFITLSPLQWEGDASPVSLGNGTVDLFDWVQVGRFVAGLDTITNASEFQKVDCAPRDTLGDGKLTVADWVQAGRYAAGLDPRTLAGGPTTIAAHSLIASAEDISSPRQITVQSGATVKGMTVTLPITMVAQGDETALAFSLNFDPKALQFVSAVKGSDTSAANLVVNANQAAGGQVAMVLCLPSMGSHFPAGTLEIAKVTFVALASSTNNTVSFADQPVARSISDANATELAANYLGNSVIVNPQPTVGLSHTGNSSVLSWPTWAGDFTLQAAGSLTPPINWTNVPMTLQTNGNNIQVTLPTPDQQIFFRLSHP